MDIQLTSVGIRMPAWFNVLAHNAVNDELSRYKDTHHKMQWQSFGSAWNSVAYRARAATEHDEEFIRLVTYSDSPPPEDRYRQDHALYSFFTCALSAIECFFYAAYCFASIIDATAFPMSDASDLRGITPASVAKKFESRFPNASITSEMQRCCDALSYRELINFRNALAHRGTPPRNFAHTITFSSAIHQENTEGKATIPSNLTELSSAWNYNFTIDHETTRQYARWVEESITSLIVAAETFCIAEMK